jgi:regulation of enolase protein 1 (concanavalin A-like superfamily)
MTSFVLQAIPKELHWENPPLNWKVEQESILTITAGKATDLFTDPQGNFSINNSPRALFTPQGNFLLSAKVKVAFAATFDAGVLLIYGKENSWAKLCFEFSPQKQPMIVSVVNRGIADDCNSVPIDGNHVYLRIARVDQAFTFHFSTDGRSFWHLVRYFTLDELQNLAIGFSTQSPTGNACTAVFSEITYTTGKLKDIRSGE